MSDDAKRAILARRARFMAAAMASIATTSCDPRPHPCLSARPVTVDGSAPMPCLSVPPMIVDAGEQTAIVDAGADGDAGDAGDGGKKVVVVGPPPPPPHPCLSAPPQVCLKPPPPNVCLEPPF